MAVDPEDYPKQNPEAAKATGKIRAKKTRRGGKTKRPTEKTGAEGRPKIEFTEHDWAQLVELCSMQCTEVEICAVMRVSPTTLEKRIRENHDQTFKEFFDANLAAGRVALRRAQFRVATVGHDVTMLKWLGQQYLGQNNSLAIGNTPGRPFKLAYALDEDDSGEISPKSA